MDNQNYKKEIHIRGSPISIPVYALQVITEISKKSICKIILNKEKTATGFFCLIPFPDETQRLPVLITNNHVLGEEDITNIKL